MGVGEVEVDVRGSAPGDGFVLGDVYAGLYPLLRDNTCRFLVGDFDGPTAMLDALAHTKAARVHDVPTALEVSQSGRGTHVSAFFAGRRRAGHGPAPQVQPTDPT